MRFRSILPAPYPLAEPRRDLRVGEGQDGCLPKRRHHGQVCDGIGEAAGEHATAFDGVPMDYSPALCVRIVDYVRGEQRRGHSVLQLVSHRLQADDGELHTFSVDHVKKSRKYKRRRQLENSTSMSVAIIDILNYTHTQYHLESTKEQPFVRDM